MSTQVVPQAPAQVPIPFTPPQDPSPKAREYSEGSMYDELNPEDLKAWHGRYAAYKQWRHEIPTKNVKLFGHTSGSRSTQSFGLQVGVGSADWNWRRGYQLSDTGTVPTTIMEGRWEQELEKNVQAPVASAVPSQPNVHIVKSKPSFAPPAHTQPPNTTKPPPNLSRQPSIHQPTQPILAQPISQSSQVKQPPTASRYPVPAQPSKRVSPPPGTLLVPYPTHSATHAERESYLASVINLPVEMLIETQDGVATSKKVDTHISRSRSGDRAKGRNASNTFAGSNTTLTSTDEKATEVRALGSGGSSRNRLGRSVTDVVKAKSSSSIRMESRHSVDRSLGSAGSRLERSITDGAKTKSSTSQKPPREHHYQASDHLPVPCIASPEPHPTETTINRAARLPLPPSYASTGHQRTATAGSTVGNVRSRETTIIPQYQPNSSEAIISQAAREPLPPSTIAETIKLPNSVKTAASGSAALPLPVPTEVTIIQAGTAPLPASTIHAHTSYTAPIQLPSQVPLLPSMKPHTDLPYFASPLPSPGPLLDLTLTHRQQMPLPRPALTPRPSNDALDVNLRYVKSKRGEGSLMTKFESATGPDNGIKAMGMPKVEIFEIKMKAPSKKEAIIAPQPSITRQISQHSVGTRSEQASVPLSTAPPPNIPTAHQAPSHTSQAHPMTLDVHAALTSHQRQPSTRDLRRQPVDLQPPVSTLQYLNVPGSLRSCHGNGSGSGKDHSMGSANGSPNPTFIFSPQANSQHSGTYHSNEDQVSFEVPQGSRRRLRVTLKWLKDGSRKESSTNDGTSQREGSVRSEKPPAVPPKELPRQKGSYKSKVSRQTSHRDGQASQAEHPIPADRLPSPNLPPINMDFPFEHQTERENQPMHENRKQYLNPTNPAFNPILNPYYAGAPLPPYNPTQVYNVRMPFAYPLPQPPGMWGCRPLDHGQSSEKNPKQSSELPGKESVDPPSEKMSLMMADGGMPSIRGLGMRLGTGVGAAAVGAYPQPQGQREQYSWQQRSNVFQCMFNRDPYQPNHHRNVNHEDEELPSEDIHAWRHKIPSDLGQAHTAAPTNRPSANLRPAIANTFGPGTAYDFVPPGRAPNTWWKRLRPRRQIDVQSTKNKPRLPDLARLSPSHNIQQNLPRTHGDIPPQNAPYVRDRFREKEEKRRQRAAKRHKRQRRMTEQTKSAGLSSEALARTDARDWPKGMGNDQLRGRSRTMIKDWVTKVRGSGKIQPPPKSGPATEYVPWRNRLIIKDPGVARLHRQSSQARRADGSPQQQRMQSSSNVPLNALKMGLSLGGRNQNVQNGQENGQRMRK